MWLITNFGFFSVVQKPDDPKLGTLTVRSRVLEDLESLKEQYFKQTMGEIQVNAGTDYKYRAKVPREAMAGAMSQIIMDLNYSNFKNSVAENQGYKRASVYSKLWETLYKLQDSDEIESDDSPNTSQEKQSYGGILINKNGEILLRKPTGEFDGYVWTFPKGKNEPGMTPEETALEEVLQETGYRASIISKIPGKFKGGTGVTEYYLMKHSGKPESFDPKETESIKWVSREEAFKLISLTKNEKGKKRDLQVLEAGTKTYDGLKKKLFSDVMKK